LAGGVERRLFPVHGVGSDPILNFILAGARLAPVDANRVDVEIRAQIKDDPLGMQSVILVRKRLSQIRVALPESPRITVGQPRIATIGAAIVRAAAVGKTIAKQSRMGSPNSALPTKYPR